MTGSTGKNPKKRASSRTPETSNKKNKATGDDVTTVAPSALTLALGSTNLVFPSGVARNTAQASASNQGSSGQGITSPYASSYHADTSSTATAIGTRNPRSGLKIGTTPFELVRLGMPKELGEDEKSALKVKFEKELQYQEANPPALPRSQIEALPPKELVREYKDIPEGLSDKSKKEIRDYNNDISKDIQRIDRQRNNQAAKKSRETRLEALKLTREMLNDKAAECAWMRLKVIQLGGSTEEWDGIDRSHRDKMVELIEQRVKVSDQRRSEEKKREENQRRAERTRVRTEQREREREMASASPFSQTHTAFSPMNQSDGLGSPGFGYGPF